VIAEPLIAPAVNEIDNAPSLNAALSEVGASGAAIGVAIILDDATLAPIELIALILIVYATPLVSPVSKRGEEVCEGLAAVYVIPSSVEYE
jgi:hypothetical protein